MAGVDEAGRGPLAGPVVAAAVVFPVDCVLLPEINDSKKLSGKKRQTAFDIIQQSAMAVGVGIIHHPDIDRYNILQATYMAMNSAIENLAIKPDYLLIDGRGSPQNEISKMCIVKGDAKSMSVAAASIIAKVTRDNIMLDYHKKFPQYNFAQHKGYPTKQHIEAIRQHGLCPFHRRSFHPKSLMTLTDENDNI